MSYASDSETVQMLQRLNRQICRPVGISSSNPAYRRCMDEGLIKFHEWPSGHYSLTNRGRALIQEAP